jgi:hypothetical protein
VAARSASDGALSETAQDERRDGTAVRAGGGAHNETSAVIEPSSDGIDPTNALAPSCLRANQRAAAARQSART